MIFELFNVIFKIIYNTMIKNKIKKISLVFGDLIILHLSLFTSLCLRYGMNDLSEKWSNHLPSFLFVFIIFILILYLNNFYNLNTKPWGFSFFKSLSSAILFSGVFSIIYFYLATENEITPKTNLLIFLGVFFLLFSLWRLFFQSAAKKISKEEGLAIIGFNDKTLSLLKEIKKNPGTVYQNIFIFKNIEELNSLSEKIAEKNIKNIVICDDFGNDILLRSILFKCLNLKLNFYNYSDFYEAISGKIPVEVIDNEWFLNNIKEADLLYFNSLKSVLDFFIAIILLILTLPISIVLAIFIKIDSRGPVFFKQIRVGKNEQEFKIIKFRSMKVENNNLDPVKDSDTRITAFGRFIRKSRLDEIPQLINIIKGEMSFIGPRPEQPSIIKQLEKEVPFYKTRLLIKPGISGWDQVSGEYHGPSTEDTIKKLQSDLFYIKNRSLYLDGIISLKTITTILSRSGK